MGDVRLQELRAAVARLEGLTPVMPGAASGPSPLRTGLAPVDGHLSGGGLLPGAMHDILSSDAGCGAATGFVLSLLSRHMRQAPPGIIVWAGCRGDLWLPGLTAWGLDPGRVLLVRCRDMKEVAWTAEEALAEPEVVATVAEMGALDFSAGRRLQLAASDAGRPLFLLRPARERKVPSAAATRWIVDSAPQDRWSVSLLRCRSGSQPRQWRLGRPDPVQAASV